MRSAAAWSAASQSGSGNASGLSSATHWQSPQRSMARLLPAAKPRFSPASITSTAGKAARTAAAVPSPPSFSTTIVRAGRSVWRSTWASASSTSSRER